MKFNKSILLIVIFALLSFTIASASTVNLVNLYNASNISNFNASFTSPNINFNLSTTNGTIVYPYYNFASTGLVLNYTFNETALGNVIDYSGLGNNGTPSGYIQYNGSIVNVTFNSSGANFDSAGTNNYIKIPSYLFTGNEITVNMYLKPISAPPSGADIFFSYGAGSNFVRMQLNPNENVQVYMNGTNFVEYEGNVIGQNNLNTLTYNANTGDFKYYINGRLVGTFNSSGKLGTTTADLYIGSYDASGTYDFNGSISQVQIYNRALTLAEVQALNYTASNDLYPNVTSGLVSNYMFTKNNTYNSTIVYDVNQLGQGYNVTKSPTGFNFNGVNQKIVSNKNFNNTPYLTSSVFVKPNSLGAFNTIYESSVQYYLGQSLILTTNDIYTVLYNGVGNCGGNIGTGVSSNVWTMLSATYDGRNYSIYKNGNLVYSVDCGAGFGNLTDYDVATSKFNVGMGSLGNFNGTMDDLTIYNRSLDANEVKMLYASYQSKYNISTNSATYFNQTLLNADFVTGSEVYTLNTSQSDIKFQARRKVDNAIIPANFSVNSSSFKANDTSFYLNVGSYLVNATSSSYVSILDTPITITSLQNNTLTISNFTNARLLFRLRNLYLIDLNNNNTKANVLDFNVTLSSGSYTEFATDSGTGTATFDVVNGTYNYTVMKNTFLVKSGTVTIGNGTTSISVNTSQAEISFEALRKITGVNLPATFNVIPLNNTNPCYQEQSNISTACGGLDTGNYSFTNAINDGNFSTNIAGTLTEIFYMNYTKPFLSSPNSLWKVRDDGATVNLTITNECWNYDGEILQLRVRLDEVFDDTYWECYNGTWTTLRTYSSTNDAYEEAMYWYYNNTKANDTIFYLDAGTYNVTADPSPYFNKSELFTISAGEVATKYMYNITSARVNFYLNDLATNTNLTGFNITIIGLNDTFNEVNQTTTDVASFDLFNGTYQISVTKDNYIAILTNVVLPLGTTTIQLNTSQAYARFRAYDQAGIEINNFNVTINGTKKNNTVTWSLLGGSYNATFSASGYTNITNLITVPLLSNSTYTFNANFSNATIFLRIYDAETLKLINTSNTTVSVSDLAIYTTATGNFSIVNLTLQPQIYTVFFSNPNYFPTQTSFTYTNQGNLTLTVYMINITSTNAGLFTISTLDSFNNNLASSDCRLQRLDLVSQSWIEYSQGLTDSNGQVTFGVVLNSYPYRAYCSNTVNGRFVANYNAIGGGIVSFTPYYATVYLTTSSMFSHEELANLQVIVTGKDLVNNISYLSADFLDGTGVTQTVCIQYSYQNGAVKTVLDTNCVSGASGTVNYNGGFALNRSYTYYADVYAINTNGAITYYDKLIYPSSSSAEEIFSMYAKWIILGLLILVIGLALHLRNLNIFWIGSSVLMLFTTAIFPSYLSVSLSVFLIALAGLGYYLSRKKESGYGV